MNTQVIFRIQIHLMLFFISMVRSPDADSSYSNTSHVILYPGGGICNVSGFNIQIHLMLFFILGWFVLASLLIKFKYISCYSLSKVFQNGTYLAQNSNTSHVILYLHLLLHLQRLELHSNTSHVILYPGRRRSAKAVNKIQIHLMLFFIKAKGGKPRERGHSNTSHVILYQSCVWLSITVLPIQIHLMLFFITEFPPPVGLSPSFKYISCYSLSRK